MTRSLLVWAVFAGTVFCSSSWAADPLVKFPKGDFTCTVTIAPHDVPKVAPSGQEHKIVPHPKKLVVTKSGNLRHDEMTMSDGSVSHLWDLLDKKLSVREVMWNNRKNIHILKGRKREEASPKVLHFDADSVSWITESALSVDQSRKQGSLLHYTAEVIVKEAQEISDGATVVIKKPAEMAIFQAWIDSESLLPVKFDDGRASYALQFSSPPASAPAMSPDAAAKLKRWEAALAPRPHL